MPYSYKDRLVTTVSAVASSGTGAFTISTASSNYVTFAAGDDAKTFEVTALEGTAWEVFEGAYTHSGTSLSRGTLIASSTGSRVTFTTAAVLTATPSAATATRWNSAALQQVSGTDADMTMEVGTLYVVDMSAWATADRNYTLPAVAAVGDRVGVMVTAGDASHELILKANTGDTLNGVSAAEWSRLFITGEVVIMRCVVANATWMVEYDGRIPQKGLLRLSTAASAESAGTWTQPSTKSGVWTADVDVGSVCDTANDRIIPRRLGKYMIAAAYVAATTQATADKQGGCGVYIDSVAGTLINNATWYVPISAGRAFASCGVGSWNLPSLGNGICYTFYNEEGTRGALASASATSQRCFLSVSEILP